MASDGHGLRQGERDETAASMFRQQGERDETAAYAKGRSYRIYRYNTFHHVGHLSTLAQPTNRFNPGCYSLLYDWLLPAEARHDH